MDIAYADGSGDGYGATVKAKVKDRAGNVREVWFNADDMPVAEVKYTGRIQTPQTPKAYSEWPALGDQVRSGDPASFLTKWSWNEDLKLKQITTPDSRVIYYVYEVDYNATTPINLRGNMREVRRYQDANPNLETGARITEQYAYNGPIGCGCARSATTHIADVPPESKPLNRG